MAKAAGSRATAKRAAGQATRRVAGKTANAGLKPDTPAAGAHGATLVTVEERIRLVEDVLAFRLQAAGPIGSGATGSTGVWCAVCGEIDCVIDAHGKGPVRR